MREMAKNAVAALAAAATLLMAGCAGDQASRRADDPGQRRGSETTQRSEGGTYAVPDFDKDDSAGGLGERTTAPRGAKSVEEGDDTTIKRGSCLSGLPGGAYGGSDMQGDEMGAPEARATRECPDWMEPRGTGGPGQSPVP